MDIDDYILAELKDGGKHFSELANLIVPKICARQTLVKHLEDLRKQNQISRKMFEDRTTKYYLMSESLERANKAKDIVTLESLIDELDYRTKKELKLELVKPESNKRGWSSWLRYLSPTKKRPEMNFGMQLDKATLRIVNLISSTSETTQNFENIISEKLKELKLKMPGTIKDEFEYMQSPRDWNEIKDFSKKMLMKHGLRFLLYSYYDGEEYKKTILSTLESLERLERDHEEDIYFLDDLNKRCYYSSLEHYCEQLAILEDTLGKKDILHVSDPFQFLEEAFWFHHGDGELIWLEVALVSEGSRKLPKETVKDKVRKGALKEIASPYKIIKSKDYFRMKLPLLTNDSKARLVKNFLNVLSGFRKSKEARAYYSSKYRLRLEDYILAIDLLSEKVDVSQSLEPEDIESVVMNFKFYDQHRLIDLSDQPVVRKFMELIKTSRSKKWLEKCLSLGLPLYQYIPFRKLGFEVRNIL